MALGMQHLTGVDSGCAVSSVVEHFLDTEGVRGSNPLSRTILRTIKSQRNRSNSMRYCAFGQYPASRLKVPLRAIRGHSVVTFCHDGPDPAALGAPGLKSAASATSIRNSRRP